MPPFEFLQQTYVPLLNRMGTGITLTLERPGFYPAGGGKITAEIDAAPCLRPLHLHLHLRERGAIGRQEAVAILAGVPEGIAARELAAIGREMGWSADQLQTQIHPARCGPGNAL